MDETEVKMCETNKRITRKRAMKVNSKQKKILLQFMADNPAIFCYKITPEFTIKHHNMFWQNMSAVLNIFGPPRKTTDSWKKAWKDIKLRYKKVGIDLKGIINTLKSEQVVDTNMLLNSVEKLNSSKGKVQVERIIEENDPDKSSVKIHIPGSRPRLLNDIHNINMELESSPSSSSDFKLDHFEGEPSLNDSTSRREKSGNNINAVYVPTEEVNETDMDYDNDAEETADDYRSDFDDGRNHILTSDYSDSEYEDRGETSRVSEKNQINRQFNHTQSSSKKMNKAAEQNQQSRSNSSREQQPENGRKRTVLTELLTEIRKYNTIQSQKLTLKKNYTEHKKLIREHTLDAQKEMAKAHVLLATSIKSFVDNISFNN